MQNGYFGPHAHTRRELWKREIGVYPYVFRKYVFRGPRTLVHLDLVRDTRTRQRT